MPQNFQRAVEEGKEVLDKRAGKEPITNHLAWCEFMLDHRVFCMVKC